MAKGVNAIAKNKRATTEKAIFLVEYIFEISRVANTGSFPTRQCFHIPIIGLLLVRSLGGELYSAFLSSGTNNGSPTTRFHPRSKAMVALSL